MSDLYEYDVDGNGTLDLVEVTQDSDGGTLVVADLDGDGYGDVAAYDADGDGQPDEVTDAEAGAADPAGAEATTQATQATQTTQAGAAPTYSQWAADQAYHDAYVNNVYGDSKQW
jgi:hypothetical protein